MFLIQSKVKNLTPRLDFCSNCISINFGRCTEKDDFKFESLDDSQESVKAGSIAENVLFLVVVYEGLIKI